MRADPPAIAVLDDCRHALRTLFRQPALSLPIVGLLGLAIGANTAIFGLVNAALFQALPYPAPDRLVLGQATFDGRVNPMASGYDYYDYREQARSFERLAAMGAGAFPVTVQVDGQPERAGSAFVTWDLFATLGVRPALGRGFTAADAAPGQDYVVVISHGYWQRRFGGASDVLDRPMAVAGRPVTIIGVMPAGFHFMDTVEVWRVTYRDGPLANARRFHNLLLVGRLAPGVTLARAQEEVDLISARLEQDHPDTNRGKALWLDPLHAALVADIRPRLRMLATAVLLVLLMASANVAGLLLARGQQRRAELAVRAALGAGRGRLIRQALAESLVLAAAGGLCGLALALVLGDLLVALVPVGRLGIVGVAFDPATFGFVAAISLVTGLAVGLLPARRGAAVDAARDLGPGRRVTEGRAGARLRGGLVVAQVALGVVLLVSAGLLGRSLARQMAVDPGFDPAGVLTAGVPVSERDHPDPARRAALFASLVDEVRRLPGVEAASLVSQLPIRHPAGNLYVRLPGEAATSTMARSADFRVILPGYFETMRMPLVAGRDVADTDDAARPPVTVISESLAALLFPDGSPLGRTLLVDLGEAPVPHEIVGVVADARLRGVTTAPFHAMYMSLRQVPRSTMHLVVRTASRPEGLIGPVEDVLRRLAPGVPLAEPATMPTIVADSLAGNRALTTALGALAAAALVLSLVGLYSVLAFHVTQQRRDVGVRMALGAAARDVVWLVLGRGLALAGLGLVAGLAGAYASAGALRAMLYQTAPTDPVTFAGVGVLFALVSTLACLVPAWRATRVDPVEILRAE